MKAILPGRRWSAWQTAPFLIVIPCMLLYFVFFYYTGFKGFCYSLTDWNGISPTYQYIGLKNYADALHSTALTSTLRFTVIFAVTVILLTNGISMSIALMLDQNIKGRGFFRSLFFLPAVMSSLTISYVFQQMDYRLIADIGERLGNQTLAIGLLGSTTYAPIYVSLIQVWLSTAITTVIYLAGLQSVPQDMLESARIDGANAWQVFWRIKLPMIMPSVMINLVNVTKNAISAFDIIMGTTGGGPHKATYSFSMYMYLMYSDLELAYACAIAMIMFVLFAAIALIQIVFIRSKEVEL